MSDVFLSVCGIGIVSLVYVCLVSVMFFMKGRIKRISSKFFSAFLILTIFTILVYVISGIISLNNYELAQIFGRFTVFIFTSWEIMLIIYLFIVFKNEKFNKEFFKIHKKKFLIYSIIIIIVNLVLSFVLPFEYKSFESKTSYGMSGVLTIYYNVLGVLAYCVCSYLLIKNGNNVDKLTKILFFLCLLFLFGSYIFEFFINESLNKIPFIISSIVMFLYLSLESQDALLLDEYNESVIAEGEISQLKSDFIMNMSHQLRSPMNSILGFTDSLLLSDNISINNLKEDTESIKISSRKLLELINSIIDLSKLENNNEIISSNNYKLENIVYDISSNMNAQILKENLNFSINANEDCFNDLIGDDKIISKIIKILLKNAIDHTEYGEVSLNISSVKIDSLNAEFTYLIKNSGHTMSVENFNKSLNDIVKLSNENNYQIDSNSLNIIIAKNLIDKMGGTIEFINETGKGTQYIVKFKQKINGEEILGNIREKIQTIHDNNYKIKNLLGKRVLIIDDKNISMVILERLLVQYNVMIDKCLNPKDSVDLIVNNNYDIVFLEHSMNDMSGEEVINRLNATGNKIPFIVGIISDDSSLSNDNEYNALLKNPIEFKDLNMIINSVFGGDNNGL